MLRSAIPHGSSSAFEAPRKIRNRAHLVRQNHAHSWVEALIARQQPGGPRTRHWLSLDPTPSEELAGADDSMVSAGWKELLLGGRGVWRSFVLDYNTDRRSEAASLLTNGVAEIAPVPPLFLWIEEGPRTRQFWQRLLPWLIGAGCMVVCGYLLRRLWPTRCVREPAVAAALAAYDRLRAILKQHLRIAPRRTQTPLEFAYAAQQILRYRLPSAELVALPERIVNVLYRVEYGAQTPNEGERQGLEIRLTELAAALKKSHARMPARP